MIILENDYLRASFQEEGAEWRSFQEKVHGTELLWQADPAFWPRSAPLLFPIVGALKNNRYRYGTQEYTLGRHGFARDRRFTVLEQDKTQVVFSLESDAQTKEVYPFDWHLEAHYRLSQKVLSTTFRVTNTGSKELLFSLGAHPAFVIPRGEEAWEDHWLEFEFPEPLTRHFLNAQGLFSGETQPLPTVGRILRLTRTLFEQDAVIIKKLRSSRLTLRSDIHPISISLEFPGFPYLGLWCPPQAPFVCLEPWCGLADSEEPNSAQSSEQKVTRLEEKEGIVSLPAGEVFQRTFAVTVEGI